jgi:hypothetical protein
MNCKFFGGVVLLILISSCTSIYNSGYLFDHEIIEETDVINFSNFVDAIVEETNYKAFESVLSTDFVFISQWTDKTTRREKVLKDVKKVYSETQRIELGTKIHEIKIADDGRSARFLIDQPKKRFINGLRWPKESYGMFEVHIIKKDGRLLISKLISKRELRKL